MYPIMTGILLSHINTRNNVMGFRRKEEIKSKNGLSGKPSEEVFLLSYDYDHGL